MKINTAIANRVEHYEQKRGIKYIKTNSTFFKVLKIIFTISFAYAIFMNLLTILSWSLRIGTEYFQNISNSFYAVLMCSVLSVIGFILVYTKLKFIGSIVSSVSAVFNIITYAPILADGTKTLGYKDIFFIRHFIPFALIIVLSVIMITVIIISAVKFKRSYKIVERNMYNEFCTLKENDPFLTWESFLNGE